MLTFRHWNTLLRDTGWRVVDADRVAVEHFAVLLDGHEAPITTRFITTEIDPAVPGRRG